MRRGVTSCSLWTRVVNGAKLHAIDAPPSRRRSRSLDGVKLHAIDATCSVCTQALWAIVRLMIANIVGKFAQLLQTIGRQRMSEVEQQGRRAVLVYY